MQKRCASGDKRPGGNRWQAGSPETLESEPAFVGAMEQNMKRVYRTTLRITRNREDAEDAAQQSMLNAYVHRRQFQGTSSFSTWLTRIAINEALGHLRRGRNERLRRVNEAEGDSAPAALLDTLSSDEESCPDAVVARGTRRRMLHEAIDRLRGESRAIVWLLGIHERPIREAAQVLNISESAVKARFYRARRQLRECLAGRV
jgi:RNA polymerase sigma-70 factor, ECF subfamily